MSTASRLDNSVGIGGIRERLTKLQDQIKEENNKADSLAKDKDAAHRKYCKIVGRAKHLKEKVTMKEEEIEKTESKITEVEGRIREKELFIKEAVKFQKDLKGDTPNEGESDNREKQLNQYKALYSQGHQKYMEAKEHKIELEDRCEHAEIRDRDINKKLEALNQELEYSLVEEGRRAEQCKQAIDGSFRLEKNIIGVQKMLDAMVKRKEDASKKAIELQKKINTTEDELENVCYDRRVIEATIREILVKSK